MTSEFIHGREYDIEIPGPDGERISYSKLRYTGPLTAVWEGNPPTIEFELFLSAPDETGKRYPVAILPSQLHEGRAAESA